MAKVVFIGNYKGGVGKTTTTINLAECFSKSGKSVLTIDLDPQSSLSEIQVDSFLRTSLKDIPDTETLNYVFDLAITEISKYPSIALDVPKSIIKSGGERYDFVPSSLFYRKEGYGLDTLSIRMKDNIEYLTILKNFINLIQEPYDIILIDCPPASNLMTQSAFLLSDYYLIPTILDTLSTNGVIHYINTINQTYKKYCVTGEDALLAQHIFGDCPRLIGIFYNMIRGQVNYNSADNDFKTEMKKLKPEPYIFPCEVNNLIDIARATEKGVTSSTKPDFSVLARQIMDRID